MEGSKPLLRFHDKRKLKKQTTVTLFYLCYRFRLFFHPLPTQPPNYYAQHLFH